MSNRSLKSLPLLPLRDIVVFPGMVAPLFVGRKQSVNALNQAMTGDKKIFLLTQKDSDVENPKSANLYNLGTVSKILQLLKLPDGTIKVLVEGLSRSRVIRIKDHDEILYADCEKIDESKTLSDIQEDALSRALENLSLIHI